MLEEQLQKEGRKADREDREKLELLKLLLRHPGWMIVVELMGVRKQELGDEILMPAKNVDECVVLEGKKGELRGILYLEHKVGITIAGLEMQFGAHVEDEQDG